MYKEKKTELNDEGWVYGIIHLQNNKAEVLFNGELNSCHGCHRSVKYDRIFGPGNKL